MQRPFVLYTTPLSANGRKALAVCHHLGLEPRIETVDVYRGEGRAPEYLEINPWGKIPTLVDGELTLWESNAILIYLAEAYGEDRLWSRDPRRRAEIGRWLFWESSHWQPAFSPVLAELVGGLLRGATSTDPGGIDWGAEPFHSHVRFLDQQLGRREHLVEGGLTLADLSIGAMMMYLPAARFPFARFPALAAWYDRVQALEAWKATAAGPWAY